MVVVQRVRFLLLSLSIFTTNVSVAEEGGLSCSSPFSDNMVLQCDRGVPLWGWSKPNVDVSVAFAGNLKRQRQMPMANGV